MKGKGEFMPETSISFSSRTVGTIKVESTDITAEGYPGYPRLIIPVHIKLNLDYDYQGVEKRYTVLKIQSTIVLSKFNTKIADSLFIFTPYVVNSDGCSIQHRIEFPLNFPQVRRIEEERQEELGLRLGFYILIVYSSPLSIIVKGKNETIYVQTHFEQRYFELPVEIPQSHWVKKVLPLLGAKDCFIIEVPKGKGMLQEAWNYIEKADVGLRTWHPKEVYANCRACGVLLNKTVAKECGETSDLYMLRWGRAYKEFDHFASLELHSENPKGPSKEITFDKIEVKKADCECLIFMTKALVKYAEELLEECKLIGKS